MPLHALTRLLAFFALLPTLTAQDWVTDIDIPAANYQALFNTRTGQGYRPVSITASDNSVQSFAVVWHLDSSVQWVATHNVDSAGYQSRVNQWTALGYRPLCVDCYGEFPNERYVTVWVRKPGLNWAARHRMTSTQFQTQFNSLASSGYRPYWIGASGAGSNRRLCGLWVQDDRNFIGAHDRFRSNYTATVSAQEQAGRRWISSTSYGTGLSPQFAGAWVLDGVATRHRAGMTPVELQSELIDAASQGFRPTFIDGHATRAGTFYDAAWQEDTTRQWTVTGQMDPQLDSFDDEIRDYMTDRDISSGALAVVRDGRLVLARGYTYAPQGAPVTQPGSLFRIASISKPLTAVGVLRLVERGRIGLDDSLGSILDMSAWTDTRARNITVRQLLQHWGGFDRDVSFDPMFYDNQISAALGRSLPTDPQMVIDFMANQSLDFAPGGRFAYSNFGYSLLGRIIEEASGLDYEDYMLREVLGPIGASGMRIGDSILGDPVPGEVDYVSPAGSRATSVMGNGGTVPMPYGGFNLRTMDSHGGWVASAVDLARFATAFDDPASSPLLSSASINAMWGRPRGQAPGTPTYYGMGWSVRELGGGAINTWHTGSLPGTWTIMVRRSDDTSWVALFNQRSVNGMPSSGDIDGRLHTAANAVASWPTYDLFRDTAAVTRFGDGCPGNAGVPELHLGRGTPPLRGAMVDLELLDAGGPSALLFGASNAVWNGVPLPLDLGLLGAAGCSLFVSADTSLPMQANGTGATISIPMPIELSSIGREVYMQSAVVALGANGLGVVSSNGIELQIGGY